MKIDLVTILISMGGLFVGGIAGGFLIDLMGWTGPAWINAIIVGIVQIMVLSVLGVISGKLSLTTLLIGAVLIFVGGIFGGFVVDWLGFTETIWITAMVLFIQTIILMMFGMIGKGKQTPLVKSK